jgi:hypothetical protein
MSVWLAAKEGGYHHEPVTMRAQLRELSLPDGSCVASRSPAGYEPMTILANGTVMSTGRFPAV